MPASVNVANHRQLNQLFNQDGSPNAVIVIKGGYQRAGIKMSPKLLLRRSGRHLTIKADVFAGRIKWKSAI